MVNLQKYQKNVRISMHNSSLLADRLIELFGQVILRLPAEEQFEIPGQINFLTKRQAIEYWDMREPHGRKSLDFRLYPIDGNCEYSIRENVKDSNFIITIIVDNLEFKSDDYIRGLIAHEISEMSYTWRVVQGEKENLKKLKPKAREVRINQITKQNAAIGTKDRQEHENNIDNEARRLGFGREIEALNSSILLTS